MNINLINRQEKLYKIVPAGNRIVEYYNDEVRRELFHIQLFDPQANTVFEVTPERLKIKFIEFINCIYNCKDIFYTSCAVTGDDRVEISVYKYVIETNTEHKIFSCIRNFDIIHSDKKIKIFLLNEFAILFQTEVLHDNSFKDAMGSIEFNLTLYNLDTGGETVVSEANFINNGVNTIIPISEKKIMVKTGYSFLEDPRLEKSRENDAFIESIYITTVAKFIADITLSKDSVDMPLIESTYFDKHMTMPQVTDKYIHYSVLNSNEENTRCVFYNHETDDRIEYIINFYDTKDLYITNVIDNTPYVRINTDTAVNYFNLKNTEIDVTFYNEEFISQLGNIFILREKGHENSLHIYNHPKLRLLLEERRSYEAACRIKDDYYIYC